MRLSLSDDAYQWFKDEIDLPEGEGIRIFGKYGGSTPVHTNLSVGIEIAVPREVMAEVQMNGLLFFIENDDEWFFNGYDLEIDYDPQMKEPIYRFIGNVA